MLRVSLLCVALVVGCKSKDKAASGNTGSAGAGSATAAKPAEPQKPPTGPAPKIAWTDSDGELLVASDGEMLTAACGLTGKVTPTEVTLAGDTQPWNALIRDGRKYSMPRL